jgi:hypothetical protein
MLQRLGNALVLIGLIVLVVFLITFSGGVADLRVLLAGAGMAVAGLVLRRRGLRWSNRQVRRCDGCYGERWAEGDIKTTKSGRLGRGRTAVQPRASACGGRKASASGGRYRQEAVQV